jgi:nucleoside-diphosphate-sugar epimerase
MPRSDVRDPLPSIAGVDQIYHLACPASPVHFETRPIDILQTCFNGATNVLDYAVKHNARILLTSTSGTALPTAQLLPFTNTTYQRFTVILRSHASQKATEGT